MENEEYLKLEEEIKVKSKQREEIELNALRKRYISENALAGVGDVVTDGRAPIVVKRVYFI